MHLCIIGTYKMNKGYASRVKKDETVQGKTYKGT
jgi:hypothetical protein